MADLNALAEKIAAAQSVAVKSWAIAYGELTLETDAANIISLLTYLRDDPACEFHNIVSVCGADYPERAQRFDVVYMLQSLTKNHRVRIKLKTDETSAVPSAFDVFPGVLWFERETYDMYGVIFTGHPDMRRLLTDYEFEGYPLRKDFPLTGYKEVRYDDSKKRVVYEPVRLQQEFRNFDFLSPWEGYDNENSPVTGKR